jgi:hypothetical protein
MIFLIWKLETERRAAGYVKEHLIEIAHSFQTLFSSPIRKRLFMKTHKVATKEEPHHLQIV